LKTGGSQTDIASLTADDIDWPNRRLYYERAKLESRGQGRACLAIGSRLASILKRLPAKGYLFPNLVKVPEAVRAWHFCKKRRLADVEEGVVLHSYRYAWAEMRAAA
jgi:integrase